MTQSHPATWEDADLLKQCQVQRGRASGPGGQHRNKVETAITILHGRSGAIGRASERRETSRNQQVALFRLRVNLALMVRTDPPRTPSELWRSRRQDRKLAINPSHRDFPALLAEALDHLQAVKFDPVKAASRLEVSTSQIIKLLKVEPRALELVNTARASRGQHPLQ